jgi:hypothetical protein
VRVSSNLLAIIEFISAEEKTPLEHFQFCYFTQENLLPRLMINVLYANIIKKSQMALSTRKLELRNLKRARKTFIFLIFVKVENKVSSLNRKTNANINRETCSRAKKPHRTNFLFGCIFLHVTFVDVVIKTKRNFFRQKKRNRMPFNKIKLN